MRVLVTGGGGFLGRHLVASLAADSADVDAPGSGEVDLTRDDGLRGLAGRSYDQVFHLAAWTRAGRFCRERGGEQWVVNQRINTNVLDWWRAEQPQAKLIAFGTSASYSGAGPHREENYLAGLPTDDYYAYAMTKRMLLVGLQALAKQYGLDWLYLVPSTMYGPGYHTDGRELHFVYDVARKIVRARRFGDDVELWGTGQERRELVHVGDAARVTTALAGEASGVVNLSDGRSHAVADVARALCEHVGYPFEQVRFDPSAGLGAEHVTLSGERLAALLGDRASWVPLDRGLAEVADWVSAHLDELG